MKLTNEDYIAYEQMQKDNLKKALMTEEAVRFLLKWLDSKIKRKKK